MNLFERIAFLEQLIKKKSQTAGNPTESILNVPNAASTENVTSIQTTLENIFKPAIKDLNDLTAGTNPKMIVMNLASNINGAFVALKGADKATLSTAKMTLDKLIDALFKTVYFKTQSKEAVELGDDFGQALRRTDEVLGREQPINLLNFKVSPTSVPASTTPNSSKPTSKIDRNLGHQDLVRINKSLGDLATRFQQIAQQTEATTANYLELKSLNRELDQYILTPLQATYELNDPDLSPPAQLMIDDATELESDLEAKIEEIGSKLFQ